VSRKKITTDVLDAFLHCKFKAHLRKAGEQGTRTDYEALLLSRRDEVRQKAIQTIQDTHGEGQVAASLAVSADPLKAGPPFVLEAVYQDDLFCLKIDGLKKLPDPSRLGPFHYAPVLFHPGEKVGREQRLLLELHGLLLAGVQGPAPFHGFVWHGKECRCSRVALKPGRAEQLLRQLRRTRDAELPMLVLNDHCQMCEFKRRCYEQAVKVDNLSLLRGIGEKEIRAYARKGVLTLTQLAHTFRPHRRGKRAVQMNHKRHHALQALAIRDKRVYVLGTPDVPKCSVRIYLDVEGVPDEGFVYLIGLVVCKDGEEKRVSFWADGKDQEADIFRRFLDEATSHDDFKVFCYGGYERTFIKRMRKTAGRTEQVDRVLDRLVNVLSVVYDHLYFPCHSNGLKDVAGCLGCSWTEPDASGIQSLVWRAMWEGTRDEEWKAKLLTYNLEDCTALKRVAELIDSVGCGLHQASGTQPRVQSSPAVASVDEIDRLGTVTRRGRLAFFHPEYDHINKCARFDYQRQRVYVRTLPVRKKNTSNPGERRNRKLRVSSCVQIESRTCSACGSANLTRWAKGTKGPGKSTRHKKSFDLIFTPGGVRRKVIEYRTSMHECRDCGHVFIPERYQRLARHSHGLVSWAMFQHVAHQTHYRTIKDLFKELFGLAVCESEIHGFKSMIAHHYESCHRTLIAKVLSGKVLHIDETEVKLRTGKAYVWVFATAEEVVYMLRPNREGSFLVEVLKDFKGVLVSDFYAAYDAVACVQQKCLLHLIRDMNQDLLANPYDEDLQSITGPFGILLRAIVQTIDEHGLKQKFLMRHEPGVAGFFRLLDGQTFRSEVAETLRGRLLKNRDKLFAFIRYDGVGWNNNMAENAIRQFAYYREDTPGMLREEGLNDYLVLLSLHQTCRYRGVSFLKFLLSRETDMDAFCQRPGRRRQRPSIEVYPEGHRRHDYGQAVAEAAREELQKIQGEWDLVERINQDGSMSRFGRESDSEGCLPPVTLTFNGDAISTDAGWSAPPVEFKGRCRMNPKRKPHPIDLLPSNTFYQLRSWKGHATQGIYELTGDDLRICIPTAGGSRPTSFDVGKGNCVYTLKRRH
jgi:predicted RecB family nuclease